MQRNLTPLAQVNAVDAFVRACGGSPKRSEILELVARLNGAANWNELERPAREGAFSKKMRELLAPWAKRFKLEKQLREFTPAATAPANLAVMQAIYQIVLPQSAADDGKRIAQACVQLQHLAETAEEVAGALRKEIGEDRVVEAPQDVPVWTLSATMFDDEASWDIEINDSNWDIPDDLIEEVREVGVVAEATVTYPRGDRYGVPEEATDEGCREWLWADGFALATTFEPSGEDSGDDSMARCEIRIHIPQELVDRIAEAVGANSQ